MSSTTKQSGTKRKADKPASSDLQVPSSPPPPEPPVKKARSESPPPPTPSVSTALVPKASTGRLAKALGQGSGPDKQPVPVDVLLKGLDPTRFSEQEINVMHDKWYTSLMNAYEQNERYFKRPGLMSVAGMELKLSDHKTNKTVPYKTGSLSRGGPTIRSPLFVKYRVANITPKVSQLAKERFASSGEKKDNDSCSYYLDIFKLRGKSEIAEDQEAFKRFLATDVATFAMLVFCKEKETPFNKKIKVQSALLRNPKEGWEGAYTSLDQVPFDDPIVCKYRDEWLKTSKDLLIMSPEMASPDNLAAFTFTGKATNWITKEQWTPLNITYMAMDTRGKVQETSITDEDAIMRMMDSCPYGIDFGFKPTYAKEKLYIKFGLEIQKIIFFPQLAFLTDPLINAVPQVETMLSEEDEAVLRRVEEDYFTKMQQRNGTHAITHVPMTNGNGSNGKSNGAVDNIKYDTTALD